MNRLRELERTGSAASDGAALAASRGMSALDLVLPNPRLRETNSVELALPPERAWELVRHLDLGRLAIVRALFALRTLPDRLRREHAAPAMLRIDDLASPERPGFRMLIEDAPREFVMGAIGRVWEAEIPFVDVREPAAYRAFAEPGYAKVAWALRVSPFGERDSHLECEVRVDATDDESWRKFQRYFLLIGPGSHFIRKSVFASLAREYGTPSAKERERPMTGDELLDDAGAQFTHGITMAATPDKIWPWLVQMGCRRAGYYSIDALDNAGTPSAREIIPELQHLAVGDVIPATPEGDDGFEVLRIDPNRALVLGGLFDAETKMQLPFASPRPARFSQVTWSFVLEQLDADHTRVHVRARAAFSRDGRLRAALIRPVHALMETVQLRNLAARVEGR